MNTAKKPTILLLLLTTLPLQAEEPSLPSGLQSEEPTLPGGLDLSEPDLPDFGSDPQPEWPQADKPSWLQTLGLSGFWELRGGTRIRSPIAQEHSALAETRLSLSMEGNWQGWQNKATINAIYDDLADSQRINLESGEGWLDLREAWTSRRLGEHVDLKAGRQTLTWGVGDLVFINDLFPKDWNSFLLGREEQYLKAPSDALRLGAYSQALNINLVYTPRFDSDRYVDGRRVSYFNAMQGKVVGQNAIVNTDQPAHSWRDDEWALRIYRSVESFEWALYAYEGFWKSPAGFDPTRGVALFPRLRVWGTSIRGPAGPGLLSTELGYYDSRDDQQGQNPLVNNSEWRSLIGYEWEALAQTTLGLQYYVESLQDYNAYRASLMPGQDAREEHRQVLTMRLTYLAYQQTLRLSLFSFYSPSDQDVYLRPHFSYQASDQWTLQGGLNLFGGTDEHSFFGQFESNSNIYAGLRYSF